MTNGSLKYYLLLVLAMILWGGSWVAGRIVVFLAPPFTIGFFRFLIATLFFVPLLLLTQRRAPKQWKKRDIGIFFLLGLIGIFGYGILFLTGMRFTTAGQGAIIAGFNPVTVSLFAHLLHKERLATHWRYSGFILSFLGIVFVVGIQSIIEFQPEYLIGNGILICAMLSWGLYSALGKTAMRTNSSLDATTGGVIFGTMLFGIGALTESFWTLPAMTTPVFWMIILFFGVFVTFLGFLFYFIGIKELGATKSAIFISLVPVFGTLFSAIILLEPIYWTFTIGLLLVVTGIIIINDPRSEKQGATNK
jgi:drug/metabolite transporter (DMT)-like permease